VEKDPGDPLFESARRAFCARQELSVLNSRARGEQGDIFATLATAAQTRLDTLTVAHRQALRDARVHADVLKNATDALRKAIFPQLAEMTLSYLKEQVRGLRAIACVEKLICGPMADMAQKQATKARLKYCEELVALLMTGGK
jgi:hypothetical protein